MGCQGWNCTCKPKRRDLRSAIWSTKAWASEELRGDNNLIELALANARPEERLMFLKVTLLSGTECTKCRDFSAIAIAIFCCRQKDHDFLRKSASPLRGFAKFRRGPNTVITPFKAHRANFKLEEDRGKIEEDRGKPRKIEEDRGR